MNTPFHTPRVGDVVRESHALAQQQRRAPVSREVVALPAPGEVAYRSSLRRGLVVCVDLERWREVVRPETEGRPGWEVVRAAERVGSAGDISQLTTSWGALPEPEIERYPGTKKRLSLLWDSGKKMFASGRSFTVEWAAPEMADELRALLDGLVTFNRSPNLAEPEPEQAAEGRAVGPVERQIGAIIPRIESAVAGYRALFNEDPAQLHLGPEEFSRLFSEVGHEWGSTTTVIRFMDMRVITHMDEIVPFVKGHKGRARIP